MSHKVPPVWAAAAQVWVVVVHLGQGFLHDLQPVFKLGLDCLDVLEEVEPALVLVENLGLGYDDGRRGRRCGGLLVLSLRTRRHEVMRE